MANQDRITALVDREIKRRLSQSPKKPFSRFANYKYESELKKAGDTITVPLSPKITLNDSSSKNGGNIRLTSEQAIPASDRNITTSQLVINKLHDYREVFSDLEEVQTAYSIKGERTKDLIEGMETAMEVSIIAMLDAFAASHESTNVVKADLINVNNVTNIFFKMKTKMSKKELPMSGRIAIVSPEVSAVLAQAKVFSNTESGVKHAVEGYLGKLAGFEVFESNLIETGDCYFFLENSYNYVRQLYKMKVTEASDAFAYNLLAQIAHGGKVFDQNDEQVYKLEVTTVDTDTYRQEVTTFAGATTSGD